MAVLAHRTALLGSHKGHQRHVRGTTAGPAASQHCPGSTAKAGDNDERNELARTRNFLSNDGLQSGQYSRNDAADHQTTVAITAVDLGLAAVARCRSTIIEGGGKKNRSGINRVNASARPARKNNATAPPLPAALWSDRETVSTLRLILHPTSVIKPAVDGCPLVAN